MEDAAVDDATPIPDLPVVLLSLCLQKLQGDAASICAAACVCTAWRAAAKDPNVWRIISVGKLRPRPPLGARRYSKRDFEPSPLALRMTGDVFTRPAAVAGVGENLSGAVYLTDADLLCLRLPAAPALRGLSITSVKPPCPPMGVTGRGVAEAFGGRTLEYLEVLGIKSGATVAHAPVLVDVLLFLVRDQPFELDVECMCESCTRLVYECMIQRCKMANFTCPNTWCTHCAVERGAGGELGESPDFCEHCAPAFATIAAPLLWHWHHLAGGAGHHLAD